MDDLVYRIMFSYTAFGGPLYKFYAKWTEKEGVVNYEIESVYPDRKEKGTLDEKQSMLFLAKYNCLINNKEKATYDVEKIFEHYEDVPTFQLVLSEGLREIELDTWQWNTELYDVKPLYEMILICDDKADFLKD